MAETWTCQLEASSVVVVVVDVVVVVVVSLGMGVVGTGVVKAAGGGDCWCCS